MIALCIDVNKSYAMYVHHAAYKIIDDNTAIKQKILQIRVH